MQRATPAFIFAAFCPLVTTFAWFWSEPPTIWGHLVFAFIAFVAIFLAALPSTPWLLFFALSWSILSAGIGLSSRISGNVYGFLIGGALAPDRFFDLTLAFNSVNALLLLIVTVLFFALMPRQMLDRLPTVLAFICSVLTVVILAQTSMGAGWVSDNLSMLGCNIAVTYPFVFHFLYVLGKDRFHIKSPVVFLSITFASLVLPIVAVLLTKASVPVGTMAVVLFCAAVLDKDFRVWAAVISSTLLAAAAFFYGDELLNSSGRYEFWAVAFSHWRTNANIWVGTGLGSAATILPFIGKAHGHGTLFSGLHNEWLQILFEQGIVGLVLWAGAFAQAVSRALRSDVLFSAVMGLGVYAFFDYPTHMPLNAFVGASILALCFSSLNGPLGHHPITPKGPHKTSSRPPSW